MIGTKVIGSNVNGGRVTGPKVNGFNVFKVGREVVRAGINVCGGSETGCRVLIGDIIAGAAVINGTITIAINL